MCLYQTPSPENDVPELYFVYAEVHPDAKDSDKCWVVKEKHGWFDDTEKKFKFSGGWASL